MLPKRRIAFFAGLLAAAVAAAQNTTFELGRVDFWRPADLTNNWIVIKADGVAGTPISGNIKTTSWKKLVGGAVEKKPVAYASGCTPRIGACLIKNGSAGDCSNPTPGEGPAGEPASYFARGIVLDPTDQPTGLFLPVAPLQRAAADNVFEYPATAISEILPHGKVQYFENFRIRWEWSVTSDPNGTWSACGISENPLYVTRSLPKPENPGVGYRHFHTLLYIGCKYADGATSDEAMVQGVWAHFQDRAVAKVDGSPLMYYGKWRNGNLASYTHELLDPAREHGGMCMAWTRLFLDIFKVQGFKESRNFIKVKPLLSDGFFVKTWETYEGNGSSGNPNYPYRNEYIGTNENFYSIQNSYNWTYAEVVYVAGISQNNNNPTSDFGIHIVARVADKLYDPSYGVFYGMSGGGVGDIVSQMNVLSIYSYYKITNNDTPIGKTYKINVNNMSPNDNMVIYKIIESSSEDNY